MPINLEEAKKIAIKDLSNRLEVAESDIDLKSTESTEFPNACLGAARAGEMCADMMLTGWKIHLGCQGSSYEYRAAKNQVRLFNFSGQNFKIYP
ncbi:MAG: hypothetical protein JNN15_13440 [Blastocatellia bacterium]|nr:hypothetical protein [Blastocatellia bacterium]